VSTRPAKKRVWSQITRLHAVINHRPPLDMRRSNVDQCKTNGVAFTHYNRIIHNDTSHSVYIMWCRISSPWAYD